MDETAPKMPPSAKVNALSAATAGSSGGGDRNNDAPTRGSAVSSSGQWDRFEVKLSKPSGKQKLGMVLKHAQVGLAVCTGIN